MPYRVYISISVFELARSTAGTRAIGFEFGRVRTIEIEIRSHVPNIIRKATGKPKNQKTMVVASANKAAGMSMVEKVKKELKDSKTKVTKLELEVDMVKEELLGVTAELKKVKDSLTASEASKKETQVALQKKEEDHDRLQKRLDRRSSAPQQLVVEKELNDTQKGAVGTLARKTLWVTYKQINDLSFLSGEIYKKCFEEMNVTNPAEQKSMERSIRLEYCRTLSQHKYHVKTGIMNAWAGKCHRCVRCCYTMLFCYGR